MRNIKTLVLMSCLLAADAGQSRAQNTVLNVVQDLRFKLTGYYQMSPTENPNTVFRHAGKVTITNKDIINLLEQELNIIFSGNARLLLISGTPVDLTPKVVVRDTFQGQKFDTDVTQYFSAQVLVSIEDTKINKNPVKANGKSYDVVAFELKLTEANFRIQGFANLHVKTGYYEREPAAIVHTGKFDAVGNGNYQVSIITPVVPVSLMGTVEISGTDVKAMTE